LDYVNRLLGAVMSAVDVRLIELPRDTVPFVKSWWPIYADDPHWVPPLIMERKRFFDPAKNPFFRTSRVQCFMAYRDGRPVGTISATFDLNQQATDPGVGVFGFFEFINDESVARALLEATLPWFKSQGVHTIRGPFNFTANHEFGLLVDGFDTDPCIANPHNRDYYGRIYEAIGLVKAMDWYAYWLDNNGPPPPAITAINERILKRNPTLTLRKADMANFTRELDLFYEIYNDAWEHNWGHVRLDRAEFDFSGQGLKDILNPDLCWFANLCWFAYMGDECAGASITLPDFNQVAKKMNGRIFPFGWWHYLTGRRKIDVLRVFVLGIKQKYQHLPLGAPLYAKTWEEGRKLGVRGAECSLVLENNVRMRGALEKMGGRVYKTYRTYEMPVPGMVQPPAAPPTESQATAAAPEPVE
jgi:hypothetical protein